MISWHKVGQKVTLVRAGRWCVIEGEPDQGFAKPQFGEIYTVAKIVVGALDVVAFALRELGDHDKFAARQFRPVYPEAIEQLRGLGARLPTRSKEDA